MNDALIATLAAYGPLTLQRLAALVCAREGRVQRRLDDLWRDGLVDLQAGVWYRLSMRGQQRAARLRTDEPRFGYLIRTRVET